MKRRFISLVLTCVMLLGLIPMTAKAADICIGGIKAEGSGFIRSVSTGYYTPQFKSLYAFDTDGNRIEISKLVKYHCFCEDSALYNELTTAPKLGTTYYSRLTVDLTADAISDWDVKADDISISIPGFDVAFYSIMEREAGSYLEIKYTATRTYDGVLEGFEAAGSKLRKDSTGYWPEYGAGDAIFRFQSGNAKLGISYTMLYSDYQQNNRLKEEPAAGEGCYFTMILKPEGTATVDFSQVAAENCRISFPGFEGRVLNTSLSSDQSQLYVNCYLIKHEAVLGGLKASSDGIHDGGNGYYYAFTQDNISPVFLAGNVNLILSSGCLYKDEQHTEALKTAPVHDNPYYFYVRAVNTSGKSVDMSAVEAANCSFLVNGAVLNYISTKLSPDRNTVDIYLSVMIPSPPKVEPTIVAQPQSPVYDEFADAQYSVTVQGEDLSCTWFMDYKGTRYCISNQNNGSQPWEKYAGKTYGASVSENGSRTTFTYTFSGIGAELEGASIYAVIEDGHYDITSNKAQIHVKKYVPVPPTVNVPKGMDILKGENLDLYCHATSNDGSSLSYLWYETPTGAMQDIVAINRGTETGDTLHVDTGSCGIRYYVCGVTTANGARVYSSVIPVTVREKTEEKPQVTRVFGADRYQTAFKAADTLKAQLGVSKFQNVIVASGTGFADALAGSYLAAMKNAPILLVRGANVNDVKNYIKANLASGGTVYLLGGVNAVPQTMETGLDGFKVKRLGGANRYDTNLLILQEAGVGNKDIIVCTGLNFADSLSASATGLPILLVKDGLYANQKEFLKNNGGNFIVVGGTNAVNATVEKQLASYGGVKRLAGNTRYDTSVLVAKEFFKAPKSAVLAYAQNFPDGLSGGPLAYALKAPLILTDNNKPAAAVTYATGAGIKSGYALGGTGLISDKVVKNIFSMASGSVIQVIK